MAEILLGEAPCPNLAAAQGGGTRWRYYLGVTDEESSELVNFDFQNPTPKN